MKKLIFTFLIVTSIFAETKSMYIGLEFKLTEQWNQFTQLAGGHAGMYWGPFALGGKAYTSLQEIEFTDNDHNYKLKRLTYGGLDLRFMPESFSFLSLSANCLMGASLYAFEDEKPETLENELTLTVEPGIQVLINVSQFIRLGCGVSYCGRLYDDLKINEEITGISSNIIAQFGTLNQY